MKILMFGPLPPRVGGVSKSVETLLNALKVKGIESSIILNFSTFKPFFKRYDIVHIHYSKTWKRILGLLIGKIVAKKTILTLHGKEFYGDNSGADFSFSTRITAMLSDGIIFLNQIAKDRYMSLFSNNIILDSIFMEGVLFKESKGKKYIQRQKDKTYILVYAFDRIIKNSKDVYGVDFILKNVSKFDQKYMIVLVDINQAYKSEVDRINSESLVYLGCEVDFLSLLSEVDIYLRPTTTDGNSVALQEALMLGKRVLASDVVSRPKEATVYKSENFNDLFTKLENIEDNSGKFKPNSVDEYIVFCKKTLR